MECLDIIDLELKKRNIYMHHHLFGNNIHISLFTKEEFEKKQLEKKNKKKSCQIM